tara:strand:- start:35 stop:625 length:591 start_codon:yes stop_codon:yes gene_type:complete
MRQVLNTPYWYNKHERIPKELCEEIINICKKFELDEAGVYGSTDSKDKIMHTSFRKTNIAWIPKGNTVENLLQSHVGLANIEAGWNFTVTDKELAQFSEYKKGYFYNWHKDVSINNNTPHRKLSITVNLSDPKDYEGGDLQMKNYWGSQDLSMPTYELRKQGTVIVFPSMLMHRVTKVTKGTRYSLVQWYSGPQFT